MTPFRQGTESSKTCPRHSSRIGELTPSLPELDLAMNIPSNVHNCAPILVAYSPLGTTDLELLDWLKKRPTVLVSLGTHFEAYVETVKEQAPGPRMLLQARVDVQVVWKYKGEEASEKGGQQNLNDILGHEI